WRALLDIVLDIVHGLAPTPPAKGKWHGSPNNGLSYFSDLTRRLTSTLIGFGMSFSEVEGVNEVLKGVALSPQEGSSVFASYPGRIRIVDDGSIRPINTASSIITRGVASEGEIITDSSHGRPPWDRLTDRPNN